jgi:hypothetical protein
MKSLIRSTKDNESIRKEECSYCLKSSHMLKEKVCPVCGVALIDLVHREIEIGLLY